MKSLATFGGGIGVGVWLLFVNLLGLTGDVAGMGMIASLLAGAVAAKALQRSLLGASSGFWHSVPGRWLIGRIAGLALILLLVFPVFYGVSLAAGQLLLEVYDLGGDRVVARALVPVGIGMYLATAVLVWQLRTPAKVIIGKLSGPPRRFYRSLRMGGGGSADFAGICEEWAIGGSQADFPRAQPFRPALARRYQGRPHGDQSSGPPAQEKTPRSLFQTFCSTRTVPRM